jgi:hypothetical protein
MSFKNIFQFSNFEFYLYSRVTIVVIYYESKVGLVDKFLNIQNLAG